MSGLFVSVLGLLPYVFLYGSRSGNPFFSGNGVAPGGSHPLVVRVKRETKQAMRQLMMIPVCALGLVVCSAQYIMSTGDGKMITPDSSPSGMRAPASTAMTIPTGGGGDQEG